MQYFELLFSSSIEGTNYNHEYHTCSYHLRTSPFVTLRLVTQPGDTSSSSTVAGSMSENHRNFLVTQLPPRTSFKSCIFSHHNQKPPVQYEDFYLHWSGENNCQVCLSACSCLIKSKAGMHREKEKSIRTPILSLGIRQDHFFFFFFFFFYKRVPFY